MCVCVKIYKLVQVVMITAAHLFSYGIHSCPLFPTSPTVWQTHDKGETKAPASPWVRKEVLLAHPGLASSSVQQPVERRTGFTLIQSEEAMASLLPVWVEDTFPLPISSVNRRVLTVTASRRKAGSNTKVTWTIFSTLCAPWESLSCGLWGVCREFLSRLSPVLWVTDPGLQRWGGVAQTAQYHWCHPDFLQIVSEWILFFFFSDLPPTKMFSS